MVDVKALERNELDETTGKTYVDRYKESLVGRGADASLIDQLLEFNGQRKSLITEMESEKARQNAVSKDIALKKKNKEPAEDLIAEMQTLSQKVKDLAHQAGQAEEKVNALAMTLPNITHHSVPVGKSEQDNVEVGVFGEKKSFSFQPKEHWELGEAAGILDFERAAKVTGSRFTFLMGKAARLERALIQFMMDTQSKEHGYREIIPPFIVNDQSLTGTGQFPKFKEDVFKIEGHEYYLVPTAEVPVTNLFAGEILDEADLPTSFCAYSPCFRSEAGSYGRDTKGLIRQHQFNKVELMSFAHPDKSYEVHEQLTADAESILKRLEIPYRKVTLCTGDIGFGAAKCYDLEAWLPGQNAYREISSCSNFEDFQARRANIRFRPKGGKPQFVHTLNGSGLAVGRTLIAVMENYQREDGDFDIPGVLIPYM